MNILITVCARAGSKRIKNKNLIPLAGKPLILYTIEIAKKWGKAKRIICSTDSDEIAKIARENGIEVPFQRVQELSSDTAGKVEVIRDALKRSEEIYSEKFDLVIDLDATSPLRTTKDLDKCLEIFNEKHPEVIFSVTRARRNPYFNMVELNKEGYVTLSKQSNKPLLRTQDAPQVYDMNASIYFYSRDFLLDKKNGSPLSSKKTLMHVMDDVSAFDIDGKHELQYIEYLISNGVFRFE